MNKSSPPARRRNGGSPIMARRLPLCLAITAALAVGFAPPAQAATRTWNGAASDSTWGAFTPGGLGGWVSNWSGSSHPTVGDSLIFAGSTRLTPYNNYNNLSVSDITFAAGASAFALNGNELILNSPLGAIVNKSSQQQTINMNLTLIGTSLWQGGSAGLTFNGVVTVHNANLTLLGNVTINNATSRLVIGLGDGQSGSLNLQNGSVVNSLLGSVGDPGSTGTVIVGLDSRWNNIGELRVGNLGNGTLTIENGGVVTSRSGLIGGDRWLAKGDVTVSGAGSLLEITDELLLGKLPGGSLSILDAGKATANSLVVGGFGEVKLDGGTLQIGSATVAAGAIFNWVKGTLGFTGDASIGSGLLANSATIGAGKTLTVGRALSNNNGSLKIENGGVVSNGNGLVALNIGSTASVAVSGAGAQWSNAYDLQLGVSGTGTLSIANGGAVTNNNSRLGVNAGASGSATVGKDSSWTNRAQLIVGAGGTGSLEVSKGGLVNSKDAVIGQSASAIGTVTLDGIPSKWIDSSDINVASFGNGTLQVQNGATVKNRSAYLGREIGGVGTATVTGLGSEWNNTADLFIGNSGTGTLTIDNGGLVRSINGYVGYEAGGKGTVNITGTGTGASDSNGLGSQWVNTAALYVGESGTGTVNIAAGGVLTNTKGYLAYSPNSIGEFNITGPGSSWANSADLGVGVSGSATLSMANGGAVNNFYGRIGVNSDGKGSVTVGKDASWTNRGQLSVGDGGTGSLAVSDGGVVSSNNAFIGKNEGAIGTVTLDGEQSKWDDSFDINVGNFGNGTLLVQNGALVSNRSGFVGRMATGVGTASVTGLGSEWINTNMLSIGDGGVGKLSIQDAGAVSAQTLKIGANGELTLDGGSLQIASSSKTPGGLFNWIKGTLGYTGDASIGSGLLASNTTPAGGKTTLGAGQTLTVANNLSVGSGKTLALDGGQFGAKIVTLSGGTISSTGTLDLSQVGSLVGRGTVAGAVIGGAANTISANGGNLSLGDVSALGGYAFGGTLNLAGQKVTLLSKDKAQLGLSTSLTEGGKLVSINGANLASGNSLSFAGNASVEGGFTNNGSVLGTAGSLSFLNDVDGAGSYAGNIVFKAGFKPGSSSGMSPAAVDFGGGDVTFDPSSVLDIELFGSTPGAQFDQLLHINKLTFKGTLNLIFGEGFIPTAGSQLTLFDFQAFGGSFAADHIMVTGYDRTRLDFSRLGVDGTLNVTAVPEPSTLALWLAGLGAVASIARRRRLVQPMA